eukprot:6711897-Prymnesium_polylepis.2
MPDGDMFSTKHAAAAALDLPLSRVPDRSLSPLEQLLVSEIEHHRSNAASTVYSRPFSPVPLASRFSAAAAGLTN